MTPAYLSALEGQGSAPAASLRSLLADLAPSGAGEPAGRFAAAWADRADNPDRIAAAAEQALRRGARMPDLVRVSGADRVFLRACLRALKVDHPEIAEG